MSENTQMIVIIVLSAFAYALVILVVGFVYFSPFVTWSVWLYRLLLAAYPAPFREEYGQEMLQVFRDTARAEYRRRDLLGLLMVWLRTLADFSVSVIRQYGEQSTAAAGSESVLLRDLLQQWRQFGVAAFSATAFSAWYALHLLRLFFQREVRVWMVLTAIALGTWFWSFFDSMTLVRGRAVIGGGMVAIRGFRNEGEPIPDQQWLRDCQVWRKNYPGLFDRLQTPPKPWEFRFISDIPGARTLQYEADRKTPALFQPFKQWQLILPMFPLPLLLLLGTIRAYRRRHAVSKPAIQSA